MNVADLLCLWLVWFMQRIDSLWQLLKTAGKTGISQNSLFLNFVFHFVCFFILNFLVRSACHLADGPARFPLWPYLFSLSFSHLSLTHIFSLSRRVLRLECPCVAQTMLKVALRVFCACVCALCNCTRGVCYNLVCVKESGFWQRDGSIQKRKLREVQ